MRIRVAWLNLAHRRKRTVAAVSGVAMAILLIFMQAGFYRAGYEAAVMVLDQFNFDVAIVSSDYVYFRQPGSLDRNRLGQAYSIDGIEQVAPLMVSVGYLQMTGADMIREVGIAGIDTGNHTWSIRAGAQKAARLNELGTVIMDTVTTAGFETLGPGSRAEINGRTVRIIDDYTQGPGFAGSAFFITSEKTFARLSGAPDLSRTNLGLVRVAAGKSPSEISRQLNAILPPDTRAITREELRAIDQAWTIDIKPVGIIFTSGLFLAFVIGAVILYQILASEIVNYLGEYATLMAMGLSVRALNLLVWRHALLYAVMGFIPAALLATVLYSLIQYLTSLPTEMTLEVFLGVLVLATFMCIGAGSLAIRKVAKADPAALF